MMDFIDENIWVLLSFVLFIALVWRPAGSAIGAMLDKRAADIKRALDDAKTLREEAQAELTKYQKRNREAMNEAEQIMNNALAAADSIRAKAAEAADAAIARKQAQAVAKIKALQDEAIAEVRTRAAELATAATAELIKTNLDDTMAGDIIKKDIESIREMGA